MPFPFYKQLNAMDCGPTCLRMIAKYYGRHYNADTLRQAAGFGKQGVSLLAISDTAERLGFRSRAVSITYAQLKEINGPGILHWDQNHFVVLIGVSRNRIRIADPGKGILQYTREEFLDHWISVPGPTGSDDGRGIMLQLETTPEFYDTIGEEETRFNWRWMLRYLRRSRNKIILVFGTLVVASALQLVFPFLTQRVVDIGINSRNIQYVVLILLAQLMLSVSQTIVGFIRSRLLIRISNSLNMQILSDFWRKLTRLPVSYFDVHQTGDTLQRIADQSTIREFLTGSALNTLFSIFTFAVYAIVLIVYSWKLFLVFMLGSTLYFGWVRLFLRIRRKINYQVFHVSSRENNATLQLIQGMQEIRLNNAAKRKRWDWDNIQQSLFKLNLKNLNYSQLQSAGALLINQAQNVTISFLSAKLVIDGHLTLGAMLSVQYIIGQLSGPVNEWVSFVQHAQDARISMERLKEIQQLPDEQDPARSYLDQLPENKSISISRLTFAYPGEGNSPVLKDINLYVPDGKVTAIAGVSGSGKTTLLKILLKVYAGYEGDIRIGEEAACFEDFEHDSWRSRCGAVMQDGFIFNDTVARNIAVGQEGIEYPRLEESCRLANIHSFIECLPNGFNTQLGADGVGLSQGQKQRLLIARAIYKDPDYLFFDEATNSLDAQNEREIVDNLKKVFNGRTVIIVAHRLSTVKNADKIVVLDNGRIVEEGTHASLVSMSGKYYELVKNQLELGG